MMNVYTYILFCSIDWHKRNGQQKKFFSVNLSESKSTSTTWHPFSHIYSNKMGLMAFVSCAVDRVYLSINYILMMIIILEQLLGAHFPSLTISRRVEFLKWNVLSCIFYLRKCVLPYLPVSIIPTCAHGCIYILYTQHNSRCLFILSLYT